MKNFKGAPVQGYIAKAKDESIRMAITIRGAYAGIFWFSLFHEIGHLYNDDLNKTTKFIDGISMKKNPKEVQQMSLPGKQCLTEPNTTLF